MSLTRSESDIMRLVCLGYRDKEIAAMRNNAVSTIKNTMVKIHEKLGARNRAQAVALFLGVVL